MALVNIPNGICWGMNQTEVNAAATPAIGNTGTTINSATTQISFSGAVVWSDGGTHSIDKVHYLVGDTVAQGTAPKTLRVSLQNVSTTAGPPFQPDNTDDEYADVTTLPSANSWATTASLTGGPRSVASGGLLSVVFKFTQFTASSQFTIAAYNTSASTKYTHSAICASSSNSGSTWTIANTISPTIIFEASDGTIGTFWGTFPVKAVSALGAWNSGSNPDEYALEFTCPVKMVIGGVWIGAMSLASGGDFDVVLYSGTTVKASTSWDYNNIGAASAIRMFNIFFDEATADLTFNAGDVVRISIKPTTTNSVAAYSFDVNTATHQAALPGGTAMQYTTRVDAGSWAAATTTRRPYWGPIVTQIDDGAGTGGGGLAQVFGGTQ